ncbi:hypothetical protein A3K72_02045 [Candidatus Woesearchaeota archaeon RBG_13_36_6]|nr:MAG: hypothetical protein A3K72_02045 [Candidatus Woesearchaeota archaeon RBG_13_36_6]
MDKKLIAVLFLIFVVVFSFGCKKQELVEEPAEEPQEPSIEVQALKVNNYPGNSFPIKDYVIADCGEEICSVYERNTTWAKVIGIEDRTLTLDTSYEQFQVDVSDNVGYTKVTYNVDPEMGIVMGGVGFVEGDHFNEINEGDLITMIYTVNQDNTLEVKLIGIVDAEEVII